MSLLTPHVLTPIFNQLLTERPISEPTPPTVTKRQRHRAGKLTRTVWAAISENPAADTRFFDFEDTLELPTIPTQYESPMSGLPVG